MRPVERRRISGYKPRVKSQILAHPKRPLAALAALSSIAILALSVPASAAVSSQDAAFVQAAAQGGMAEVAAGTLAEQRSTNSHVKAFATKMVGDHTKVNAQLAGIAKSKGVMLPSSLGPANMKMKGALESLHGTAFDTTYLQGQKAGHMKMETVMKTEIAKGSDPDLVSFAKTTLPAVEAHLALAEKNLAAMSGSMKMSGSKM